VLNKIDVPEARELADFVRDEITRRFGWPVHEVSTVARVGLRPLTFALWDMVSAYRDAQPAIVPRRPVIRADWQWTRAASPSNPTARVAS